MNVIKQLLQKLGISDETITTTAAKAKRTAFDLATTRINKGDIENFLEEVHNEVKGTGNSVKELLEKMKAGTNKFVVSSQIRKAAQVVGFSADQAEELAYHYFVTENRESQSHTYEYTYEYVLGYVKGIYASYEEDTNNQSTDALQKAKERVVRL
ncbi:MAG: hypothetical protein LBG52_04045 [Candidatus Peribacteria bacterium]|jgi:hypothetical protein|nr:hypothetical protein [Candidatus Peribacteria bacterium]